MQRQADDHLGREADREDVHLRHDAGDDAERGVDDDQGDDDRRADHEGRDEDARERDLRALHHRADGRRLEQRHRLVGAGQALDDPGVAPDRDEDRDAERASTSAAITADCVPVTGSTMRAEGEADQRVQQRARRLQGRRTSRARA